MSMTVCIRVAARGVPASDKQREHDLRIGIIPPYIDPHRKNTNSILIEPLDASILKATCMERRALRPMQRAMKSNAAVATIGIISFGYEAKKVILCLPKKRQDELYAKVAYRLAEIVDTDLTGLVVHRDESGPHAHFQMSAYSRNGIPNAKHITSEMAEIMQTAAGEIYAEEGIFRGTPKSIRVENGEPLHKIIHRSVAQLHADLPLEIAQLELLKDAVVAELDTLDGYVDTLAVVRDAQKARIAASDVELKETTARVALYDEELAERARVLPMWDAALAEKGVEFGVVSVAIEEQKAMLARLIAKTTEATLEYEKERVSILDRKEKDRLQATKDKMLDIRLKEKTAEIAALHVHFESMGGRINSLDKELLGKANLAIALAEKERNKPKPTPAPTPTPTPEPAYDGATFSYPTPY